MLLNINRIHSLNTDRRPEEIPGNELILDNQLDKTADIHNLIIRSILA